ncbi:MAG: hypothetical protein ACHREM_26195, partial [Polyangiales bacterium]
MLIECQHCGAPLDVRVGAQTCRCRYCSSTTLVAATKTISPETPAEWKPPQRWRPPVHVPANSEVELAYRGRSTSGVVATVIVTGILAGIAAPIAVALHRTGVIGGVTPAMLDSVTFTESVADMQRKLGGSVSNEGRWLHVDLKGPFDYAVFIWDQKDMSHPSGVAMHTSGREVCPPEVDALRAKIRKDLGPRFDGAAWRWGPTYLNFDSKCSSFVLGASVGDGENAGWRIGVESLWKLVRADVFGRPQRPSSEELNRTHLGLRSFLGPRSRPLIHGTPCCESSTTDGARASMTFASWRP